MGSLYNQAFCPPDNQPCKRYPDWVEGDSFRSGPNSAFTRSHSAQYPPRSLHAPPAPIRREVEAVSETDTESEEEVDFEYDLSNMEITEELRQYFEQTERHKEELCKYLPQAIAFICLS